MRTPAQQQWGWHFVSGVLHILHRYGVSGSLPPLSSHGILTHLPELKHSTAARTLSTHAKRTSHNFRRTALTETLNTKTTCKRSFRRSNDDDYHYYSICVAQQQQQQHAPNKKTNGNKKCKTRVAKASPTPSPASLTCRRSQFSLVAGFEFRRLLGLSGRVPQHGRFHVAQAGWWRCGCAAAGCRELVTSQSRAADTWRRVWGEWVCGRRWLWKKAHFLFSTRFISSLYTLRYKETPEEDENK